MSERGLLMRRSYATGSNDGQKPITAFVGKEVEGTLAQGSTTLFLVGPQTEEQVEQWLTRARVQAPEFNVQHLYFGANWSFEMHYAKTFEHTLRTYLQREQFLVTLDLDAGDAQWLIGTGLCEYRLFIPMISVRIPHAMQLGPRATLKVDDVRFKGTNPGVWCNPLTSGWHTLWSQYGNDIILKDED